MAALTDRAEKKEASIFYIVSKDGTVFFAFGTAAARTCPSMCRRSSRRCGGVRAPAAALGGVALEAGGALLSARLAAILSTSSPPLLTELLHTCN
jgi:hypothetical protein